MFDDRTPQAQLAFTLKAGPTERQTSIPSGRYVIERNAAGWWMTSTMGVPIHRPVTSRMQAMANAELHRAGMACADHPVHPANGNVDDHERLDAS